MSLEGYRVKWLKFNDINLYDIGNTIQLSGGIWSGNDGKVYFLPFHNEIDDLWKAYRDNWHFVKMTLDDWKKFIRQTDVMETQILAKDNEGKIVKAVLRKTQRQIEQGLQWRVFKRDGYKCRYCGIDGVPMTVDHLILWEDGGPTIEENLVTACRKCNKLRGSKEYDYWLNGYDYQELSKNLTVEVQAQNAELVRKIKDIPRQYHIKSR